MAQGIADADTKARARKRGRPSLHPFAHWATLTRWEKLSLRFHDARRTKASLMFRRGVPVAYVSKQLAHSSIHVTVEL